MTVIIFFSSKKSSKETSLTEGDFFNCNKSNLFILNGNNDIEDNEFLLNIMKILRNNNEKNEIHQINNNNDVKTNTNYGEKISFINDKGIKYKNIFSYSKIKITKI